jgi:hypothetical protein
MAQTISNTDDVIDSRDVIARIEELTEAESLDDDDKLELVELQKLESEANSAADWRHGETLIRDSYFTNYIRELIDDCYDMPKEFNSGEWPWRHMSIDYEAAAREAQSDYFDVSFGGVTYWIR